MKGPREKLLYIPCIYTPEANKPDYLATIDCDPSSEHCGKVSVWTVLSVSHVVQHVQWWVKLR